jgi:hypothetical protein
MRLVFVHGRDQHGKVRVLLEKSWSDALAEGLKHAGQDQITQVSVTFPFYGDELAALVKELDTPLVAEVATKGGEPDDREAAFRGELLQELATNAGLSDDEIAAHATEPVQKKGPLNWAWVHAVLRALDKKAHIGDEVLDNFTRDVFVYLTYPAVGKKIDKIVSEAIAGPGPCVVVAHSLGTIISYRVLSALGSQVDIRAFVTVGSPLGLNSIRNHLDSPLATPAGVKVWKNAFDRRDVVALLPLDKATWDIAPPIENYGEVKNKTDNRHGIVGYLDDATVAGWVAKALK